MASNVVLWIESQSTGVIFLLSFTLCYVLAAIAFGVVHLFVRRGASAHFKATSPVMLTPLSVLVGLVIAFLASRVWGNLDHAHAYAFREASAIRDTIVFGDRLTPDLRIAIRGGIKTYLRYVETEDWPAMAQGRARLGPLPPGMAEVLEALLSFVPKDAGQQFGQQKAIEAVEQTLEARRERIALSRATVYSTQWLVILTLGMLVFLTISMIHVDRPGTAALNLLLFASGLAACLVLLMANDRPFSLGGHSVGPEALEEIRLD